MFLLIVFSVLLWQHYSTTSGLPIQTGAYTVFSRGHDTFDTLMTQYNAVLTFLKFQRNTVFIFAWTWPQVVYQFQ